MINFWEKDVAPSSNLDTELYVINDLDTEWAGTLTLTMRNGEETILAQTKEVVIEPLARQIVKFQLQMPLQPGYYQLEAEIDFQGERVKA